MFIIKLKNTNNLNAENNIICILEIKSLKFSSQSFHLEILLRQVMIIKEEPLFNKCLIKIHNNSKNLLLYKI